MAKKKIFSGKLKNKIKGKVKSVKNKAHDKFSERDYLPLLFAKRAMSKKLDRKKIAHSNKLSDIAKKFAINFAGYKFENNYSFDENGIAEYNAVDTASAMSGAPSGGEGSYADVAKKIITAVLNWFAKKKKEKDQNTLTGEDKEVLDTASEDAEKIEQGKLKDTNDSKDFNFLEKIINGIGHFFGAIVPHKKI